MRVAMTTAAMMAVAAGATAHEGGAGDHFKVGHYNGHDGSFEAPAVPALPDTLLVDTHPWELENVYWDMPATSGNILLGDGWLTDVPGFEVLEPAEQEFNGHGFFSFWERSTRVTLEVLEVSPGLEVLRLDLTTVGVGQRVELGGVPFHSHPLYFVSESSGVSAGDVVRVVFKAIDTTGGMIDSEPFEVKLIVGGACSPADMAPAFRTLDINDVLAFATYFGDGSGEADLFPEGGDGAFDVNDVLAFAAAFTAGCP